MLKVIVESNSRDTFRVERHLVENGNNDGIPATDVHEHLNRLLGQAWLAHRHKIGGANAYGKVDRERER